MTETKVGIHLRSGYINQLQPKTEAEIILAKEVVDDQFDRHEWDSEQTCAGDVVREVLKSAALAIIQVVPPSADRSACLRKLREARMDANSAITHGGRY